MQRTNKTTTTESNQINKLKEVRHLLTYKCNLNCRHCYLDAGVKKNKEKPTKNIRQQELDNFYSRYQPNIVSATGGEPLLNLALVKKIARSIQKYGGSLELVTNGFLLTKKILKALIRINPNIFIQISLDGPEQIHNIMRNNPKAYSMAIKAIKLASSMGLKVKVRLTATTENVNRISEVIKILDELKNKNIKLVIRPILSVGRAKENNLGININYGELDKLKTEAKYIEVETTDNEGKCGCGIDTVAIDPQGDIYPCTYFVYKSEYKMGNITKIRNLNEQSEFKNFNGTCFARHAKLLL